jgi:flagellum-specific ATP synthase
MGIFAGSGIGKSVLLGMIARGSSADVNVIALVGERGREVREFIEKDLGPEGLKRSIVVAVTSDQPALIRIKGAMVATAIAEHFRDRGKNVMLLMDSITRIAIGQREIGLAVGEPPATRGYTPSVFALLPRILERAGTNDKGSITGLYTVLVEGDDMNEPVSDMVRSILDGHVALSRKLASLNQYPAVDILDSISRLMVDITTPEHRQLAARVREIVATYREAEDLINIGAYVKGSSEKIDFAISRIDKINMFLRQGIQETDDFNESLRRLADIIENGDEGTGEEVSVPAGKSAAA